MSFSQTPPNSRKPNDTTATPLSSSSDYLDFVLSLRESHEHQSDTTSLKGNSFGDSTHITNPSVHQQEEMNHFQRMYHLIIHEYLTPHQQWAFDSSCDQLDASGPPLNGHCLFQFYYQFALQLYHQNRFKECLNIIDLLEKFQMEMRDSCGGSGSENEMRDWNILPLIGLRCCVALQNEDMEAMASWIEDWILGQEHLTEQPACRAPNRFLVQVQLYYAMLLLHLNRPGESHAQLQTIQEHHRKHILLFVVKGDVLKALGNERKAVKAYSRCILLAKRAKRQNDAQSLIGKGFKPGIWEWKEHFMNCMRMFLPDMWPFESQVSAQMVEQLIHQNIDAKHTWEWFRSQFVTQKPKTPPPPVENPKKKVTPPAPKPVPKRRRVIRKKPEPVAQTPPVRKPFKRDYNRPWQSEWKPKRRERKIVQNRALNFGKQNRGYAKPWLRNAYDDLPQRTSISPSKKHGSEMNAFDSSLSPKNMAASPSATATAQGQSPSNRSHYFTQSSTNTAGSSESDMQKKNTTPVRRHHMKSGPASSYSTSSPHGHSTVEPKASDSPKKNLFTRVQNKTVKPTVDASKNPPIKTSSSQPELPSRKIHTAPVKKRQASNAQSGPRARNSIATIHNHKAKSDPNLHKSKLPTNSSSVDSPSSVQVSKRSRRERKHSSKRGMDQRSESRSSSRSSSKRKASTRRRRRKKRNLSSMKNKMPSENSSEIHSQDDSTANNAHSLDSKKENTQTRLLLGSSSLQKRRCQSPVSPDVKPMGNDEEMDSEYPDAVLQEDSPLHNRKKAQLRCHEVLRDVKSKEAERRNRQGPLFVQIQQ